MEKTTGYAVLGCGYFGAEFARAVSQMPGARLAAVYSPGESAGRVSRELGCPRAATLEQIWQDPAVDALLGEIDVLVDGPFLLAERDLTLRFRGSTNQRMIDIPRTRETGEIVLWE